MSDRVRLLQGIARFLETEARPAISDRGCAFRARIAASLLQSLALDEAAELPPLALAAQRLMSERDPAAAATPDAPKAAASSVEELAALLRFDPPTGERERAWRRAWLDALAAQIAVRNPRFDLDRELP